MRTKWLRSAVSIQLREETGLRPTCHCERSEAISLGLRVTKEEIAGGTGILPVIPNRQAGRLSHHSLLAMTISRL